MEDWSVGSALRHLLFYALLWLLGRVTTALRSRSSGNETPEPTMADCSRADRLVNW